METPLDPYLELGVPREAPAAEITSAYQRLVRRFHPDTRRPAASAAAADIALTRIMVAYAILNDPDHRQLYDRQHREPRARPKMHPPTPPVWTGPRPPDSIRVTPLHWHPTADPS